MARRNGPLVPIISLVLGVIAIALTFLAYATRIKAEDVVKSTNGDCIYPSSPACAIGIIAALFLLAAQIIISVSTHCFCCGGVRSSCSCTSIAAIVFFVLNWLAFLVAFLGLLLTANANNSSYLNTANPNNDGYLYTRSASPNDDSTYVLANVINPENASDKCTIGKEDLFLGAAFWCIISVVLGSIYYVFWVFRVAKRNNNSSNYEQDAVIGQSADHIQLSKEQC